MAIINQALARLRAGKAVVGVCLGFPCPAMVELCAYAGFHFVRLDCEHGPMDPLSVEEHVRAAEAAGISVLVRPPTNASHEILRYLDTGANGVVVPHIETRADAEAAVQAAFFYPLGQRGMATARWTRYGTAGPMAELIREANDNILLIALIESAKGLENLSEILAVKGVNAVQIGPQDLSQSLGLPAQLAHPTVQAAIDRIIDESRAAGKWVSMAAYGSMTVKKQIERGVTITEVMAKDLVVQSGRALLNELRLE